MNGVTCCTRLLGCTYLYPWILPKPHCLAQAHQSSPELRQPPPHLPIYPSSIPHKSRSQLATSLLLILCFASEAKAQPSGTNEQDKPGCLNKTCLFQSVTQEKLTHPKRGGREEARGRILAQPTLINQGEEGGHSGGSAWGKD